MHTPEHTDYRIKCAKQTNSTHRTSVQSKNNNEISIETKRTNSANKLVVWLSVYIEAKDSSSYSYDDDIVASHCMTSQLQVKCKENLLLT